MEQEIRFCELDGQRIAYATVGEGPLLLFGGRWVTHLEEEWDDPRARAFFEDLALRHRVVRYDRIGAGLSDRALAQAPDDSTRSSQTLAAVHAAFRRRAGDDLRVLVRRARDRRVCEHVPGARPARSSSSAATSRGTTSLRRRVARSSTSSARTGSSRRRCSRACSCRAAAGTEIEALSRYQRHSADADVAADFLELDLASDARPFLPTLTLRRSCCTGAATAPFRSAVGASSPRCCRTPASSR